MHAPLDVERVQVRTRLRTERPTAEDERDVVFASARLHESSEDLEAGFVLRRQEHEIDLGRCALSGLARDDAVGCHGRNRLGAEHAVGQIRRSTCVVVPSELLGEGAVRPVGRERLGAREARRELFDRRDHGERQRLQGHVEIALGQVLVSIVGEQHDLTPRRGEVEEHARVVCDEAVCRTQEFVGLVLARRHTDVAVVRHLHVSHDERVELHEEDDVVGKSGVDRPQLVFDLA